MPSAPKLKTLPEVFIIEALRISEQTEPTEGKLLYDFLRMSGRRPKLACIRSKTELIATAEEFKQSNYRYLHISCHGNDEGLGTALDSLAFDEFSEIFSGYLSGKRLFISACEAVNDRLAECIFRNTKALSVSGPCEAVYFDQAAILFSSFYYAMFNKNSSGMNDKDLHNNLNALSILFNVGLRSYSRAKNGGQHLRSIFPIPEEKD